MNVRSGVALLLAAVVWNTAASAAEVQVVVDGVKHDKGAVKVALYVDPATFRKEDKALVRQSQPAHVGQQVFTFSGLAAGRYAVVVYHDENGNGEMDRFLGMIPTEGYGLSNNPEVSGPPKFEPSAFDATEGAPTKTMVELRY